MNVLICGSRYWDRRLIIETFIYGLREYHDNDPIYIIQGEQRGADLMAKEIGIEVFGEDRVLGFPADWNRYGKAAVHIRNKQMLEEGHPDLVLAFKDEFNWNLNKGGTEDMIKQAITAKIPYYVIGRG